MDTSALMHELVEDEVDDFLDPKETGLNEEATEAMKMLTLGLFMAASDDNHTILIEPRVAASIMALCAVIASSRGAENWDYDSVEKCFEDAQGVVQEFIHPYVVKGLTYELNSTCIKSKEEKEEKTESSNEMSDDEKLVREFFKLFK